MDGYKEPERSSFQIDITARGNMKRRPRDLLDRAA